jgi:hypothetical protein
MASIADKMTLASWFKAKTDHIIDFSDEFMWATFLHRGVNDDATLVADTDEKTRDLILADAYYGAAVSSTKSGTQGESDGGWTHYVAIKNVVSRDALMQMAKDLYAKWDEPFTDPNPKIRMKPLY